jgi:hypothetical protein
MAEMTSRPPKITALSMAPVLAAYVAERWLAQAGPWRPDVWTATTRLSARVSCYHGPRYTARRGTELNSLEIAANAIITVSIWLAARNNALTWPTGIVGCAG